MVWIRISIHDGLRLDILPSPPMVVYIIWFANSEYLLSGTIKAEWKEFILEVTVGVMVHQTSRLQRFKSEMFRTLSFSPRRS